MRKLKIEIAIIAVLMVCLCVTTVALALSQVTTKNTFQTDAIDIILNNGQKIIDEDDQSIAPGKTIITSFPLKNNSDHEVYYRLYFSNIKDGEGNLADALEVTIKRLDNGKILYAGFMPNLIRSKVAAINEPLAANQEIMLEATFYLPEEAKNNLQGEGVTFDFVAEAVQSENNEGKDFGDVTDPVDPDEILKNSDTTVSPDDTTTAPEDTGNNGEDPGQRPNDNEGETGSDIDGSLSGTETGSNEPSDPEESTTASETNDLSEAVTADPVATDDESETADPTV